MFSRRNQILFAMAHSAMLKRGETVRKQTEAEQKSDPAIRNRAMAALEKMAGHTIREEKPDGPPPPPKATGTAPPPPPAAGSSPPPPPSIDTTPPPPPGGDIPDGQVAEDESADDGSARLLLLAMVRAAQADNRVEQGEKDIIFARLAEAGLTQRDQWFIEDELRKTQPLEEWVTAIPPALAGDVYAVSLMTIGQPNLAERRYLQALAERLSLDKARIDDLTEQFLNAS